MALPHFDRLLAAVVSGALITIMAASCSSTGTDRTEPSAAEAGRAKVTEALSQLISEHQLPGAQVVVTDHGRVWTASAGVGDLERGTPFPDDARVRIASNTKTFVATVMLQLTAEGKVELDAPVERYLPGVVRGPSIDGNRITIRNLLQHTSGLPDYAAELGAPPQAGQIDYTSEPARWQTVNMTEVVRNAMTAPADFEPGTQWAYSNTNYALAGMVIENITASSVGAEITRRIIEPLGLRDTYYPGPDETDIRGPHPLGYSEIGGKRVDYTSQNVSSAGAAGAMVGTGADLNRFFIALLDGKLLPPAQLTEMKRTVPTADPGPPVGYGLGLIHRRLPCGKDSWGHGGDIDGFQTRGDVTSDGRSVTVSVNQVPKTDRAADDVMKVVDVALCSTT
ncbi:serine hydrolase domain-containing protein [Nocardia iowensis]|uniref:Beta-lactamase family protein n=1 Tax=Nocardia iowensis TaxID=204891 RepID=A0ABX8RX54_NOCIO|nr:serine hydrolase domain-containing protein [Nocardia iowensis]QXN94240.1 beta-lactamase family protein [Nocardia iowensis]